MVGFVPICIGLFFFLSIYSHSVEKIYKYKMQLRITYFLFTFLFSYIFPILFYFFWIVLVFIYIFFFSFRLFDNRRELEERKKNKIKLSMFEIQIGMKPDCLVTLAMRQLCGVSPYVCDTSNCSKALSSLCRSLYTIIYTYMYMYRVVDITFQNRLKC